MKSFVSVYLLFGTSFGSCLTTNSNISPFLSNLLPTPIRIFHIWGQALIVSS